MADTQPLDYTQVQTAPRLAIAPAYTDPTTGAVYVHQDLELTVDPWEAEAHIGPIEEHIKLGDVESWIRYVSRFGAGAANRAPFLTWSERGLRAVLDYHASDGTPGRCDWVAEHPFTRSPEWVAWTSLANGRPRSQRELVEALEDLGEDIDEPSAAELVGMLRKLRASVSSHAETELAEDGSTRVRFGQDRTVDVPGVVLPPTISIVIPVLRGHVEPDEDGRDVPVRVKLQVRIRVTVDDAAHLQFRLSMPTAERAVEMVVSSIVEGVHEQLGEAYTLLRATV